MLYVVKRDGREVVFNKDKISNAIRKASKEVSKELDHNEIINITENVYKSILKTEKSSITVEEIQNLIDQFKKDEEAREETDFYRIAIPESFKDDIAKLKSIAAQLSKPSTLYKLIWKEYYENSFNAMTGRVLGNDADKSGIYKITNIKNQMVYIGQTTNFKNRWRTHAKRAVKAEEGTSNRLYQEMWNEGLENFTFQVIEICNKDNLTEREKFYIDFYNSKDYGYNSKT